MQLDCWESGPETLHIHEETISPEAFLGHLKDSQPIFVVWAKKKKKAKGLQEFQLWSTQETTANSQKLSLLLPWMLQ